MKPQLKLVRRLLISLVATVIVVRLLWIAAPAPDARIGFVIRPSDAVEVISESNLSRRVKPLSELVRQNRDENQFIPTVESSNDEGALEWVSQTTEVSGDQHSLNARKQIVEAKPTDALQFQTNSGGLKRPKSVDFSPLPKIAVRQPVPETVASPAFNDLPEKTPVPLTTAKTSLKASGPSQSANQFVAKAEMMPLNLVDQTVKQKIPADVRSNATAGPTAVESKSKPVPPWSESLALNQISPNDFPISSIPTEFTKVPESLASKTTAVAENETKNPSVLAGAENFVLAAQPKVGDHWADDRPQTDRRAILTDTVKSDFSPDAVDEFLPYDPYHQMDVYEGKTLNANQRPLVELGRPWYQLGQFSPSSTILGKNNPVNPQFLVYGDYRSAVASNTQNGNNVTQSASELNLDFDLRLTSTERFHMFMSPLDDGITNSGYLFDENRFVSKFDANIDFGYFEGDLGAIVGGLTNKTLPFDFPFAVGIMPLLFQNGVWMEDAFLGIAATIPARNNARLDISNMDTTFFAGYDKINSPAFGNDDSAARMYGMASFIEALNGYIEIDYAFLDDRTFDDRSYHNVGFGYTRRYGRFISNSTRMIFNAGQSTDVVANTADGVLLLSENSLITGSPTTVVPYLNLFAGFDRPQSAARAAQAGGILRNTGILFESDGMTNYPTLDPTANDTFGGALGLNLMPNLSQQLVVEAAWLNTMGDDLNRNAAGNQYGVGARYQLPLTNALIFRADAMMGFLEDASDVHGVRMELRHKW